jgi:LPXTG-motif cell wall-anchored protein
VSDWLTRDATDQPEPAAHLSISPASAAGVVQGGKAGPFAVTGPSGDITLSVGGGAAVDAAGKPVTTVVNGGRFYLTRDTPGEVTVSAKARATHSTGRVFLFRGGNQARQKLILAGTAGEELTAGAKAAFTPAPASTPSASPSVPAASGGGGGELARTGTSLVGPVIGGVLLLAAGLGALLVVRRRRVRFTA